MFFRNRVNINLNTTHVSVQLDIYAIPTKDKGDLNTTHVSVQWDKNHKITYLLDPFKYNPCIGSIFTGMVGIIYTLVFKYNPCIGSILNL